MSFVLHRTGDGERRFHAVERDSLRIGRGANADLRLDDPAVALEHARIESVPHEGGAPRWLLSDLGSVTGTYRNGQPVTRVELVNGDRIEIGACRIKVQILHPEDPLFLHLELPTDGGQESAKAEAGARTRPFASPSAASPSAAIPSAGSPSEGTGAAPPVATPRVDYVRAYSLARPGLTKASLTLGLTALTALLLAGVVTAGVQGWFMPGISSAHGRIVGAAAPTAPAGETADPASAPLAPRVAAAAELGCLACHQPWRGPVDRGCAECHGSEAMPHAAGQVAVPACSTCHPEHRPGQPLIVRSEETGCLSCHGDLVVAEGEPRVASRITSFAQDHPELVITPQVAGSLGQGISLASAEARKADPGRLAFNHQVHLAAGLRGPQGSVQLACADCHTVATEVGGASSHGGRMAPIAFAQHCQSCHQLSFDAAHPDRQAPHGTPQEVEDFLVGLYSRAGSTGANQSLRDRRIDFIRNGGRQRLSPGIDRQVADAARTLFRSQCAVCHRMDLDATPLPTVESPNLPSRWFARARFSHLDHGEVACNECHRGVAQSRETSDVLLPGIAECRSCHGTEQADGIAPETARWGGLLGCAQCHSYHPGGPVSIATLSSTGVLTEQ